MANILDNVKFTEYSYSLVLNSNNRLSGTHNNATFDIDWATFLPTDIEEYKVIFTFQSTSGYYCDALYQKNPSQPTVGVIDKNANHNNAMGTNHIQFNDNLTNLTTGHLLYGVGLPIGCTILSSTTYSRSPYTMGVAMISSPLTATLYDPNPVQIVNPTSVNAVGFSSARILANFGTKSYSYDAGLKGQATHLGTISRDTQTLASKSNTFSSWYCQNCPRTIRRPTNNILTISVMNNSVFQGGITGYDVNGAPTTYSTLVASSNNYLTDTVNMVNGGKVAGGLLNDMTPWQMIVEFIPIHKYKNKGI